MAIQREREMDDESHQAAIRVQADWLMALLDLDTVRHAQRPDAEVSLSADGLTISGVEVVVERRWLREPFWQQIKDAVTHGYIYKRTAVQVTLRGERRERARRPVA
ncbi:MAG TPA: hypothetical protein VIN39_08400 [Candidatus Dormibacteraeota bacterium]